MTLAEEVKDQMEALKVSPNQDASSPKPTTTPAPTPVSASLKPERPPQQSVESILAELNKSPLFMTDLEENDDIEALRALAYEGTPLENASDFKDRGNEEFAARRWADAREYYGKGIAILVLEERERERDKELRGAGASGGGSRTTGRVSLSIKEGGNEGREENEDGKGEEPTQEEKEKEIEAQKKALETLYVNRAACHLNMANYRSSWIDCAQALRLNPHNLKAYYRSSKALLSVDRIEEADDACTRGLALDNTNKALLTIREAITKRKSTLDAKTRAQEEHRAKERHRGAILKAALQARGIVTRETSKPPEMEDARVRLVPSEDDPTGTLSFPTLLLYPIDLETDFIKAFNETENLGDHLEYVLPLPWDEKKRYTRSGVECYVENVRGGLIKVGLKVALLKVLSGGKVAVVDGVVRVFVVPKGEASAWVEKFKEAKRKEGVR